VTVDQRLARVLHDVADTTTSPTVDVADVRNGARARRRRTVASIAALGLAVTMVAGAVVASNIYHQDGGTYPSPMSPNPSVSWVPPTPSDWSQLQGRSTSSVPAHTWKDPLDITVEGIDLTKLEYTPNYNGPGGARWELGLGVWPHPASHRRTVISFGVVVDSTHDGTADYVLGIDNDASHSTGAGSYRVWVTDLAANKTDMQDGPPYGVPFDFSHDGGKGNEPASMNLTFLLAAPFVTNNANWYAWSSLSKNGEVIAWDTAPDTGWIYSS